MVAQNIQTALIFEDDADWDVGLRAQMTEFAKGARWLSAKRRNTILRDHHTVMIGTFSGSDIVRPDLAMATTADG